MKRVSKKLISLLITMALVFTMLPCNTFTTYAVADDITLIGGNGGTGEWGTTGADGLDGGDVSTTVTGVTVISGRGFLWRGTTYQFSAVVTGSNNPSQEVTWTVEGGTAGTSIASDGTLTIGAAETAINLSVRATSIADNTKSGVSIVTVIPFRLHVETPGNLVNEFRKLFGIPTKAKLDSLQNAFKITGTINGDDLKAIWDYSDISHAFQDWIKYLDLSGVTLDGMDDLAFRFSFCENLEEIILPQGLTSMGNCAFMGCKNLDIIVTNAESLVSIVHDPSVPGAEVFKGCENVTVYVPFELLAAYEAEGNWAYNTANYDVTLKGYYLNAQTPIITGQPIGNTYTNGDIANPMTVAAGVSDGGTLSYQWYRNSSNSNSGGVSIDSATTDSYTPPTNTVGTVYYYCVVTNTNNDASSTKTATVSSSTAKVTVSSRRAQDNSGDTGGSSGGSSGGAETNPSTDETASVPKNSAPAFTDTTTHWAKENIDFVASRGLLTGTSATTFSPDASITRGMFVTALGRLSGQDMSVYTDSSFDDVKAGSYYLPYIEWAVKYKIVLGIGNNRFDPDRAITREEMAVMIYNYAKVANYTLPTSRPGVNFVDDGQISAWAADGVTALQQAGIVSGVGDGKFNPKGTATRAEAATILRNFVEGLIDKSAS